MPLGLLLVVALLTACTARLGGRPVAEKGVVVEKPATAVEALGELTTIDPCSLTDLAVFDLFGTAEFATPESLDYCAVEVHRSTGSTVWVMIGQLGRLSDRPELEGQRLEEISEELYTVQLNEDSAFCSQALVFAAEDLLLEVTSASVSGSPSTECEMTVAGMEQVVATIEEDGVEHRSPEPDSLVAMDPCELVDDATVTALPGFAAARREDNPGGHQCSWQTSSGEDRLSVRVAFEAGDIPIAATARGNSDPIAGRPTAMNSYENVGSAAICTVETGHIPFTGPENDLGLVEVASVSVRVPAAQAQAGCPAAKAVAAALWPKLPPA
jgi:hypothetical protein